MIARLAQTAAPERNKSLGRGEWGFDAMFFPQQAPGQRMRVRGGQAVIAAIRCSRRGPSRRATAGAGIDRARKEPVRDDRGVREGIWHTAERNGDKEALVIDFVVLLAAIDDGSLRALIATIDQLPAVVPALQAWLDHAARWEYDRRNGMTYPLQGPMAAISPEELPEALAASALIAQCFRQDRRRDVSAILAFFEGLRETLLHERERAESPLH